jgi:hypothetical protein
VLLAPRKPAAPCATDVGHVQEALALIEGGLTLPGVRRVLLEAQVRALQAELAAERAKPDRPT